MHNLVQLQEQNKYPIGRALLTGTAGTISIKNASDEDIKSCLRYVIMKIGIKTLPDEFEKQLLIEHLRQNYKFITTDDVRRAIDLAITGRLDEDANHFGSLSCMYISRILGSYLRWISANIQPEKQISTMSEHKEHSEDVVMEEWYNDLKKTFTQQSKYELMPVGVYDWLYKHGKIKGTWETMRKAATIRRQELLSESIKGTEEKQKFIEFCDAYDVRGVIIHSEVDNIKRTAKKLELHNHLMEYFNLHTSANES